MLGYEALVWLLDSSANSSVPKIVGEAVAGIPNDLTSLQRRMSTPHTPSLPHFPPHSTSPGTPTSVRCSLLRVHRRHPSSPRRQSSCRRSRSFGTCRAMDAAT